MQRFRAVVMAASLAAGACAPAQQYELRGQVLAVDTGRREISIRHEDIRGFMPGMTVPFTVKDVRLLEGRRGGDLVRARLVVEESKGYLSSIETTGHAALTEPAPVPRAMDLLQSAAAVPDVQITDMSGEGRLLSEWRGRAVAVTFTYTRCPLPDFCPRLDRQFAAVQRDILADPKMRDAVRLLTVSFDPAHDSPVVLAGHARKAGVDPRVWTFATGEPAAIEAFASRFGVSVIREGANVEAIVHNLRTAVIGSDGRLVKVFSGSDWTPEELAHVLRNAG